MKNRKKLEIISLLLISFGSFILGLIFEKIISKNDFNRIDCYYPDYYIEYKSENITIYLLNVTCIKN